MQATQLQLTVHTKRTAAYPQPEDLGRVADKASDL